MSNDSTRKTKRTPALDRADPRTSGDSLGQTMGNSTGLVVKNTSKCAAPRTGARLTLYQTGNLQSTEVDNRHFYRDGDIGRFIGLARPRDIRRRILLMIESGDIQDHQYIQIDDDEGNSVFYIDRDTAVRLAFRSNTKNAETIVMLMLDAFAAMGDRQDPTVSVEKAVGGYQRTIAFLSKKDTPRAGKLAMVPVLEKYARAAGLPMPDVSELIGPDQPRLAGV